MLEVYKERVGNAPSDIWAIEMKIADVQLSQIKSPFFPEVQADEKVRIIQEAFNAKNLS